MAFAIAKQPDGGRLILTISGAVDEDANFQPVDTGAFTDVVLDLAGVTGINSVGIREWMKWIKMFSPNVQFTIRRCPKIIVDQINMVAGFLPANAAVESFFVPYYSDASGSEKMILFEKGKQFNGADVHPPEDVKDESGEAMEMDIIETKYFKFLKHG